MGTLREDRLRYKILLVLNVAKECVRRRFEELGLGDKGYEIVDNKHWIIIERTEDGATHYPLSVIVTFADSTCWDIVINEEAKVPQRNFPRWHKKLNLFKKTFMINVEGLSPEEKIYYEDDFEAVIEGIKRVIAAWEP